MAKFNESHSLRLSDKRIFNSIYPKKKSYNRNAATMIGDIEYIRLLSLHFVCYSFWHRHVYIIRLLLFRSMFC